MKKQVYKIIGYVMIGILFPAFLIAQKPNYNFKTINQHDGLINSTVQTIFEDSFGFIWLGTHHGVQRYDGKTYKNYEHSRNDSTSLSQNYINGFCEDANRNIWITTSEGLNKYDRKTDKIKRYKWNNSLITEDGELNLNQVIRDNSDTDILWLTAPGIGLIKLDIQNDSAIIYPSNPSNDNISSWILDYPGQNNKFLVGNSSLFSFDKVSGQFDEILKLEENKEVPDNRINDAIIDPVNKDIIWLATGDYWGRGSLGGLIRYNLNTREKIIFTPQNRPGEFPDLHLLCIYADGNDKLWIGTRTKGVLLYSKKKDEFYNYRKNEFDRGSFATSNSVRSILKDRSGTVWFGTWGNGICLLSQAVQKFSWYKHLPQDKKGLPDNFINTFTEDKQGNIWIGTRSGGLSKFDQQQKTFENYFKEFASSNGKSIEITYLFYDSHENLWIGTYDDALYRYTPGSGVKVHYKKGTSRHEVSQNRISTIAEIKPGEIFISTYGGGLNIYNYNTDRFRQFIHDPKDSTSIPDNQIWLPFLGADGNYYFGGNSGAGLIRFNPGTEKFKEIFPQGGLATFMMPCITSDGTIYLNDVSEGLRELDLEGNIKVNTIYEANGNSIKNVESILVDDENILWMGTGKGLVAFDPVSRKTSRFDPDDGLQGFEFNRFAAFRSSSGEMYFGGENGFNVFHPNTIKLSNYDPPVVFESLKLFQENVTISEESPLKQSILLMDHLELNYDQNDFTLSFAALDFSNPQKIIYKYFLENHDEDWINVGHINQAGYTNMDPGKYTLKVLATNGDGIWSMVAKSIRITINPPWWLTIWAYGFYILLFVLGVFGVHRYMRKRTIRRERERSRAFKLEQAKKIEKAYNELKATQAQLIQSEKMASLGELTAGIAHEIQNPLNFVNNFAEVNNELLSELNEEIIKGNFEEVKAIASDVIGNEEKISHHGKRADAIVKGMLQHSRISNGHKQPTDLNALADEYLRLSYHGLRAKEKSFNADFKLEADATLPKVDVVPQDIGRVLLNLINNAFYAVSNRNLSGISKLTGLEYHPTVTVSTKKLDHAVEIRVRDNGKGIPAHVLDKIFQPFFTTKPAGEGTGLGLSMSYDIITKGHGGALTVTTKEGEGTEFIIVLPEIN